MYTQEQKEEIKRHLDIHTERLKYAANDETKIALKQLIADHEKQLSQPTIEKLTPAEAMQNQVKLLQENLKENANSLSDEQVEGIKHHISLLKKKIAAASN